MSARVIVCGSRKWHDRQVIADTLNALVLEYGWRFPEPNIVHGGARGADRLCDDEAGEAGLVTEVHLPNYEAYGARRAISMLRMSGAGLSRYASCGRP